MTQQFENKICSIIADLKSIKTIDRDRMFLLADDECKKNVFYKNAGIVNDVIELR